MSASTEITWLLEVAIQPGKLDDFKAVAKELTVSSKKEKGTLLYEWFLSDDGKHCHILERYKNSAAIVAHTAGFGRVAERFLAACRPVRINVYGSPSAEARKALADLSPAYFPLMEGFGR